MGNRSAGRIYQQVVDTAHMTVSGPDFGVGADGQLVFRYVLGPDLLEAMVVDSLWASISLIERRRTGLNKRGLDERRHSGQLLLGAA